MSLSRNIKELRKARKLSQEYVAEQLGVSRQAVSKWETGQSEPNAHNLAQLANLLEVPLSRLLETEQPTATGRRIRLPENYDVFIVGAYSGSVILTTVKTNDPVFRLYSTFWVFLFAVLMAVNIARLPADIRAKTAYRELAYCVVVYCVASFLTPVIGNVFSSAIILLCCILYGKYIRFPGKA